MDKQSWFVFPTQRLRPWLDTSDEMQLALLCIRRNCPAFLLVHNDQRLGQLLHQIVHLDIELLPDSACFVDFSLFIGIKTSQIDVFDQLSGVVRHGHLQTLWDVIDVAITELTDVIGDILCRMEDHELLLLSNARLLEHFFVCLVALLDFKKDLLPFLLLVYILTCIVHDCEDAWLGLFWELDAFVLD